MLHLKELRAQKGITQTDLAKSLGVSASTIGMYEQGRREPDNETLIAIANFFRVTTDYLLGKTNDTVASPKLYNNIKKIREARGMSQDELAKLVGFKSRSSINKIELGINDITQSKLVAIANALHVSTSELMSENKKTDLLDALFHDEPELLAKARNIDIKGKINEPGMVAKLTEHQKARLKDIIMFTIDEAIRNGQRTLVRIHSSKEGSGDHANTQSN